MLFYEYMIQLLYIIKNFIKDFIIKFLLKIKKNKK